MKLKKLLAMLLALTLAFAATISPAYAWTLTTADMDQYIQHEAKEDGKYPYAHFDETEELVIYVNGKQVQFPDTQPYVDANNRTLMPVRFVTEQLGADVTWNGATSTASIAKNGIRVDVTIGSKTLKVTKNGNAKTVDMDTEAVNKDSRTMVPIRFVVEALGGFVDYVEQYACQQPLAAEEAVRGEVNCRAIMIYNDVLTSDEISKLRTYPYTYTDDMIMAQSAYDSTEPDRTIRHVHEANKVGFPLLIDWPFKCANAAVVMEKYRSIDRQNNLTTFARDYGLTALSFANEQLNWEDPGMKMTFRADMSCAYDVSYRGRGSVTTIRGYVTIERTAENSEMTKEHNKMYQHSLRYTTEVIKTPYMTLKGFGAGVLKNVGDTMTRPVDVQVYVNYDHKCHLDAIVDLTDTDTMKWPGTEWCIFDNKGNFVRLGQVENANEHISY